MRISDGSSDVCSSDLNLYDKVAVYRPVVPVGKAELGFLPGTLDEKLDPWMIAVHDALVALTERSEEHTSELQSLMRISYAVFCLKKKKTIMQHAIICNQTISDSGNTILE